MDVISVIFRFLHIFSAVVLVGGAFAWLFAFIPGLTAISSETRAKVENTAAVAWRPVILSSIFGLLVSGTWNYLHKTNLPPAWHAVFGVKFLLALHVFAVTLIATKPGNANRARQLTGVAISGTIIVILSAVLRSLATQ